MTQRKPIKSTPNLLTTQALEHVQGGTTPKTKEEVKYLEIKLENILIS